MIRHVGRRLAWAVFVVWAVTSLTFVINNVIPSDPARMVAGPQARPRTSSASESSSGSTAPSPCNTPSS